MILHSLVGLAGRFVTTAYNPAPLVDLRKTDPFFPSLLWRRLEPRCEGFLVRRPDDPAYGSGLRLTGDNLAEGDGPDGPGMALPLVEENSVRCGSPASSW